MTMAAYYSEFDPYAAQWLRNLITAGHIAPGFVDERSIEDVRPDDLREFTQCHFFAGIGVWSYALRLAGWPDDRPVWTGSCPCQPFSAAGKGLGFDDPRHQWPNWYWLIRECEPAVILGEQVASKDIDPWIDLVQANLEDMGYAVGCVPFPSAGVGAPHIRDRAYFMAYADYERPQGRHRVHQRAVKRPARASGLARVVADADGGHASAEGIQRRGQHGFLKEDGRIERIEPAGPANGFWRNADWLSCRDEKWRPVESQPQPLVDGSAESLGLLRTDIITALTEEINAAAMEAQISGAEAMRIVWKDLGETAKRCWPAIGVPGLHEAPFLLAFMRQLAAQGWLLAKSIPLSRPETPRGELRGLRDNETASSASHRRELDGQRSGKRPDVVRVLSCILARHAQEAWGEAHKTYAAVGFPLSTGEPSRVGRLRAYGNAINAEAAAEFIRASIEVIA